MSNDIEVLKEARRLIDEAGWSRDKFFRDDKGNARLYSDEDGICSFCLIGAAAKASGQRTPYWLDLSLGVRTALTRAFESKTGKKLDSYIYLFHFNDGAPDKSVVLGLLDEAIQALDQQ